MPKIDINKLLQEIRFEVFASGGPGGQHANKTASGVRAVHDPTGLWAISRDHRSQYRNRILATQRLIAKLTASFHRPRPRIATSVPRQAHERRLRSKEHKARIKDLRRKVDTDL
ncbi:MAG: peptide chain release factor-like protein [bacterium]|nr:peptide chain release factor-like protein [bacterium]